MTPERTLGFATLCLASVLASGAYVYRARQRAALPVASQPRASVSTNSGGLAVAPAAPSPAGPVLLFRNTTTDTSYGRLALAPLDDETNRRIISTLSCERVDFAAGRGVCLAVARGVMTTYAAIVFDQDFQRAFTLPLGGVPTRVRVSPDGNLAAVSVFASGHSYASADFSTVTSVIDLRQGTYVVANFEELAVWKGEQRFEAVDRNFWGVTFARDSDTFYATVASAGRSYLIQGKLSDRRATLLYDDAECPSLSPNNKRLAFKRRVGEGSGPVRWGLGILDLDTLEHVALPETRNVDDQVAWLDDDHIMYALPAVESGSAETNTWVLDASGREAPRLLLPQAYSAIVWRPSPAAPP